MPGPSLSIVHEVQVDVHEKYWICPQKQLPQHSSSSIPFMTSQPTWFAPYQPTHSYSLILPVHCSCSVHHQHHILYQLIEVASAASLKPTVCFAGRKEAADEWKQSNLCSPPSYFCSFITGESSLKQHDSKWLLISICTKSSYWWVLNASIVDGIQ